MGSVAGAVEQLEIDDAAAGDLAGDEQWLEHLTYLRPGFAPCQGALVGEERGHRHSAPGAGHHVGVV
jgi:hypothetical protein